LGPGACDTTWATALIQPRKAGAAAYLEKQGSVETLLPETRRTAHSRHLVT
jgi:hypothetical protein